MANGNVIELVIRAKDEASGALEKIGDAMEKSIAVRFGVVGAAVAGAAVAFNRFVDGTLAQAEAAQKNAQKVDMQVDAYQRMAASMKLANVEEGTMSAGMRRMAQTLAEAEDKTSKQAIMLKELGITAKNPKDAMMQLADVMRTATGTTGKLAIGQEVLGRGFQELLPWLKQGSAAIKEQGEQADRLGSIMNNSMVASADNARDNMEMLTGVLTNIKNNAILPLSGELEATSGRWVKFAENSQAVKAATLALNGALTVAMKLLGAFGDIALTVAEVFGTSFKVVGSMIGAIGAALVAVVEGDFDRAGEIMKLSMDDAAASVSQSKEALAAVWVRTDKEMQESTKAVGVDMDTAAKKIKAKEEADKKAKEAAKEHAEQMKRVAEAEGQRINGLNEILRKLEESAAASTIANESDRKWVATLSDLKKLNASEETIQEAKNLHEYAAASEVARKADESRQSALEQVRRQYEGMRDPMTLYADKMMELDSITARLGLSETALDVQRLQAKNSALEAAASVEQLTATNATAFQSFEAMAIAHFETMGSVSVQFGQLAFDAMNTMVSGVGNAIAQAIIMGGSLADMMKKVLQQVAMQVISTLIQIGIQRFILAGIYQAMNIKDASGAIATGAAKVYMNTFASIAAIPIVGPAMAPGWAATATASALSGSVAAGAMGSGAGAGIAAIGHGGIGYVPEETTYFLQQGERVLSPRQNRDLTDFMGNGGGGGGATVGTINIHILENATNAEVFARMNRVELRESLGQPVIDALNEMFHVGVKPDFASVIS